MSTPEIERRMTFEAWPDLDMEVRAEGDGLTFRGYAAVFNSPSEDLGGFRETIMPGAFTRSVNAAMNGSRDIKMFLNHNSDVVLASTKAKTLRLSEDERGLMAEADLPDSAWGQPVATAVKRGDISAMSFGFNVPGKTSAGTPAQEWSTDHKQRTLHEVRLFEVSPVTGWPAYAATSASVRALISAVDWDDDEAIARILDELDEDKRQKLLTNLNQHVPSPLIPPALAERQARLADLVAKTGGFDEAA